ncbi:hypothetical protein PV326_014066, partial [Microctonus aethiopoides]
NNQYAVTLTCKNRNISKTRKSVKPNILVARPNKHKRKITLNSTESEDEKEEDENIRIIADLRKQIEDLKNEIKKLQKNQKETGNIDHENDDDTNQTEIMDSQNAPSIQTEDDDDEDWVTILKDKNKKTKIKENDEYSRKNSLSNTTNTKYMEARPPPINIFEQKIPDTIKVLKKGTQTENFKIKRMSEHLHIVKVDDYKDYKKTIEVLKETNTQYYTYTPKQDKNRSYLLKGLDNAYEPKKVMARINEMEVPHLNVTNVTRFETPRKPDNLLGNTQKKKHYTVQKLSKAKPHSSEL